VLPGVDRRHRGDNHDHKAEHTQEELGGDAHDEQGQADEKCDSGECGTPTVYPASTGATKRVDELRVFGCQRSFHLLEKPLLLV
jgi:hypothetical protein